MLQELHERLRRTGQIDVSLRVHPGAKRNAIQQMMEDGSMKMDVSAPADDGKANDAAIKLLAKTFGVPIACVTLVSGHTSRRKRVRIIRP